MQQPLFGSSFVLNHQLIKGLISQRKKKLLNNIYFRKYVILLSHEGFNLIYLINSKEYKGLKTLLMILHNNFQLISIKSNKKNWLVFSAFLIVRLFFIQKHPRDKNNVKNTHLEFIYWLFNNSNQTYMPLYQQHCHNSKIKIQLNLILLS